MIDRDGGDQPDRFEAALACHGVVDPPPVDDPEAAGPALTSAEVADLLRISLSALSDACRGDPLRLAVAVARLGGMSYAEIGEAYDLSKQAVHKHVMAISRRHPRLGQVLQKSYHRRDAIAAGFGAGKKG